MSHLQAKQLIDRRFLRIKALDLTSSVFLFQSLAFLPSLWLFSSCPMSSLTPSAPPFFTLPLFLSPILVPGASIIHMCTDFLTGELSTRSTRVITLHLNIHLWHTQTADTLTLAWRRRYWSHVYPHMGERKKTGGSETVMMNLLGTRETHLYTECSPCHKHTWLWHESSGVTVQ